MLALAWLLAEDAATEGKKVILGMLIVGILYSIFLPIYEVIGKIKF